MNIPTTAIPSNPFLQKQRFRCSKCGKQFTAVNGELQENGFEVKNAMLRCPACGGKLDACRIISR